MEGRGAGQDGALPVVTPEIAAEAAVWVARLHGPDRSLHMERECLAWQGRSAAHRLAFECCTDVWMDVAGVDRAAVARVCAVRAPEDLGQSRGIRPGPRALVAAVTATVALVAVLVVQPWRDVDTYGTGIGEQRLVLLKDGSRMSLNTSTRVRVELSPAQRRVSVEGGEAFFEVAKDASRPFVVRAAGTEVTATGTAFLVRLMPPHAGGRESVDVTLVEGQVVVQGSGSKASNQPIVMAAGDRVRVGRGQDGRTASGASAAAPERDRPRLDQVLAWQRGEAIFDNVPLREALAEMSRYSSTPITVNPRVGDLRVSGVFKTGDSVGFVQAVAALHGLAVHKRSQAWELTLK
jgi:transmembrane sensor